MNKEIPLAIDRAALSGSLEGRVVLITGAGGGLGGAVARSAAKAGARTVLLGRSVRPLEELHDRIVDEGSPPPAIYPMDLAGATPGDYSGLVDRIDEEYGALHGIVHGAAAFFGLAPIDHVEPLHWLHTLQINLNAPFFLTTACLPLLRRHPDARVIFISDRFDDPSDGDPPAEDKNTGDKCAYWGAYAASKAGLEGLARVLADEMDAIGNPKIFRIYPGSMRTSLRRRAFPAENPAEIPMPEEAADRVVFALGPGCPLANGQIGIVE
ncbi:SDR family NAD(P)-dependent oxidoreductase [Thioalkalivibrio sp. HK1]|uniref:SDR family NAD(P)-dependent oxidoreductase n=1 Tax=Thioalkalivibrio sp. HK1 TaxID=1469245 RepID=UPI0004B3DAAF|nr:SDR family NAD(P)-dependent oxidoreductase [Thioalkalivibrio sp. HK1]